MYSCYLKDSGEDAGCPLSAHFRRSATSFEFRVSGRFPRLPDRIARPTASDPKVINWGRTTPWNAPVFRLMPAPNRACMGRRRSRRC